MILNTVSIKSSYAVAINVCIMFAPPIFMAMPPNISRKITRKMKASKLTAFFVSLLHTLLHFFVNFKTIFCLNPE